MIILVINILRIAVYKPKRDAPVCLHRHRPSASPVPLELMKLEGRDVHVLDGSRLLQLSEDQPDPVRMVRLNTSLAARKEKPLHAFVDKALDHALL